MIAANSPNLFVEHITTPMLVVHGDRDYRVPIGEALRLWAELAEHHAGDDGTMPLVGARRSLPRVVGARRSPLRAAGVGHAFARLPGGV